MSDRAAAILGACAVLVTALAVVGLAIWKGGTAAADAPVVIAVLGFISTLLGILATYLKLTAVETQVNGHLDQHMSALQPEHLQLMADLAARKAVGLNDQQPAPATSTPPG